jgi:hypothetical protein
MSGGISAASLLDPRVIDDPHEFYRQLRDEAPVWEVPGTGVFTVSTFELLAEATGRVEDLPGGVQQLESSLVEGLSAASPARIS